MFILINIPVYKNVVTNIRYGLQLEECKILELSIFMKKISDKRLAEANPLVICDMSRSCFAKSIIPLACCAKSILCPFALNFVRYTVMLFFTTLCTADVTL